MWDVLGLSCGLLGAIVLAISQNGVFAAIRLWLIALDLTVETLLGPNSSPIIRPTGIDDHMKRAVDRDKFFAPAGWLLIALGFFLQLIPHIFSKQ
jgi:hypothetical protein